MVASKVYYKRSNENYISPNTLFIRLSAFFLKKIKKCLIKIECNKELQVVKTFPDFYCRVKSV